MDVERLQEALKDFEKRGKKEVCPVLDQFLCHVAKTGETMLASKPWPQVIHLPQPPKLLELQIRDGVSLC
ncbi:serine/threonine-protein phosphatase 4 regulatory subunit 2 isoform X5 [Papio anubis]|uniref:Protein phosphatase 4 regulatory subunit 2 n=2 Tax=Cercopithecinae TaxID=9528 RepID=A0A8I5NN75_PAPAN|nr:serine/threonine-protein phosphatase 4 regulatory subunit 2 isoform X5 [Papio anubis]XP_037859580.1 serine/threonine-protein phosphatase 4 regulatory subunit 2 isoform X2 [Chlorocebus sabaeus]